MLLAACPFGPNVLIFARADLISAAFSSVNLETCAPLGRIIYPCRRRAVDMLFRGALGLAITCMTFNLFGQSVIQI